MIEVKNVHFTYPNGVEALRGVSLTIRNGEFLAIMGQNGAGKTTLVKHLNGLLKPAEGEVIVDGVNTREISVANLSRKVGFVFQNSDHQLFCETIEDEVAFALRNFGVDEETIRERVMWALGLLDLIQYSKTSPLMLSGGERKRLALASVLAWDPEFIVLDEPTLGQDYQQKEKLRQFIVQLNAQGKTVIIVTHDVEFVADCAPRVVLMAKGNILTEGDAKEALTDLNFVVKASIIPPQITQIFIDLADLGLPNKVINVHDGASILFDLWKART